MAQSAGGLSRREFLYYIWGASMALFTAEFGGLFVWFALPRFRAGEFGGKIPVPYTGDSVLDPNSPPKDFAEGRFWLVSVDTTQDKGEGNMQRVSDESDEIVGVLAIYKVCTHLGCIYAWNDANQRFECPCHGSKYRLDGRRIEAPAPRSLDRFQVLALDENGSVLAQSELSDDGEYLPLVIPPGTVSLDIDTGAKKDGAAQSLLGSTPEYAVS